MRQTADAVALLTSIRSCPVEECSDSVGQAFVVAGQKASTAGTLDQRAQSVALATELEQALLEGPTSISDRIIGLAPLDLSEGIDKGRLRRLKPTID